MCYYRIMSAVCNEQDAYHHYGEFVDDLPKFVDQAIDDSRQTTIDSIDEMVRGIGADTSISGNATKVGAYTEQQALAQTKFLLEDALTDPRVSRDVVERARDVYEQLSFIGEKELATATRSIAEYWKEYLVDNPEASIFVITSKAFEAENAEPDDELQETDQEYTSSNKSDSYILDKILSNFSDAELEEYSGRLLTSFSDYRRQIQSTVKAVVLDDWIMSGEQVRDTLDLVFRYAHPADIEINLVACNEERLARGVPHHQIDGSIPVKTYFASWPSAHPDTVNFGQSYLTGAHSSGDYPFEGAIESIVEGMNQVRTAQEDTVYMPPLANILRPYYTPGYRFEHIERHEAINAVGRIALSA